MVKGKFIVFEGIDGCGKTTQQAMLHTYLNDHNHATVSINNISNSDIGVLLRNMLVAPKDNSFVNDTQIILLYAAELHKVACDIQNYINKGINVICSRWVPSTYVYAGNTPIDMLLIHTAYATLPIQPDIILYLDVHPDDTVTSIKNRNVTMDMWENGGIDKYKKYKAKYDYLFTTENRYKFKNITTVIEEPLKNKPKIVHKEIVSVLKQKHII